MRSHLAPVRGGGPRTKLADGGQAGLGGCRSGRNGSPGRVQGIGVTACDAWFLRKELGRGDGAVRALGGVLISAQAQGVEVRLVSISSPVQAGEPR